MPEDGFNPEAAIDHEDAFREDVNKRAEAALSISETEKKAHFDNFRRQVIDAKAKDLIPYVDETNTSVVELHANKHGAADGNINQEGKKKPYVVSMGSDPSALASVWEKFFGSEEALREAKHEMSHAAVMEAAGIKPDYVFYLTKTRDGNDVVGPGVYFDFPPNMPEKDKAELGIKIFSAVEDPSNGDLAQIEHYKTVLAS